MKQRGVTNLRDVMPAKVMVLSYAFSDNVGDNAIFESLLENLASRGVKKVVALDFGKSKTPLYCPDSIKIVPVPALNPFRLILAMLRVDAVVLGGGGILQHTSSVYNLLYFSLLCVLANKLLRKPLHVFRVGINDISFRFGRIILKSVFVHADSVSVRDQDSLQRLRRQIGFDGDVEVLPDPVFFRTYVEERVQGDIRGLAEMPYILVSFRPPLNEKGDGFRSADQRWDQKRLEIQAEAMRADYLALLEDVSKEVGIKRVVCVPCQFPRDYDLALAMSVSDDVSFEFISRQINFDELEYLCRKAGIVLSSRFHGCVAAMKVGAKLVALDNFKIGNLVNEHAYTSNVLLVTQAGYKRNEATREAVSKFCLF